MKTSYISILSLLASLLAFFNVLNANAGNDPKYLLLEQRNGDVTDSIYFDLSLNPAITFDGVFVYVALDDTKVSYDEVIRFTFAADLPAIDPIAAGIGMPITTGSKLTFRFLDSQTIVVNGSTTNQRYEVFDVSGRTLSPDVDETADGYIFHLNNLPSGLYIIKIGSQSFKITKR